MVVAALSAKILYVKPLVCFATRQLIENQNIMKNILDVTVSRFENCKSPDNPQDVNLLEWLRSDEYRPQIEALRSIEDKAVRDVEKRKLPCITISGTFSYRNKSGLIRHSGLICIDVDAKDNPGVQDFEDIKRKLSKLQNVAYCGFSASGRANGLYCIIPIAFTDQHDQHFDALKNVFSKLGITIDAGCRDVCRLRGYSWDEAPYINPHAVPYTGLYSPPKPQPPQRLYTLDNSTAEDVETAIAEIRRFGIDITGSYDQWLKLGFALADEFGEAGRRYFHEISQFYRGYNHRECDHQYTACLRGRGNGIGIATFFHYCKQHGITLRTI